MAVRFALCWFDGWISVEETSGNGLDGLTVGIGYTDAVWQSVRGARRPATRAVPRKA